MGSPQSGKKDFADCFRINKLHLQSNGFHPPAIDEAAGCWLRLHRQPCRRRGGGAARAALLARVRAARSRCALRAPQQQPPVVDRIKKIFVPHGNRIARWWRRAKKMLWRVVQGRRWSSCSPSTSGRSLFHLTVYHKSLVHGLHGLTLPAQQSPGPSLTEPNSKSCMREVRFDFEFVRFKLRRKDACRGSVAIWGSPPFRMFCGSLLRAQKWRMPEAVRVVRASAACCSRD